ncbi:MAG: ABC transporter substrate-binding protein [Puniceicoccaceae bacterium]
MKNLPILLAITIVIALPFLLRKQNQTVVRSDDTLIVITPHDEGIRHEFEVAFAAHYLETTGRTIDIDWRVIGGTSEIIRYIQSTYTNNFRNYWENELGKPWNAEVQNSFMNRRITLDDSPQDDTPAEAAKRAFLNSNVTCGIDILFGGGSYDFIQQAAAGTLVPFASPEALATMLPKSSVPLRFAGEPFYDKQALWAGAVLSQFGIIYNLHSLQRLDIPTIPSSWEDLTDPRYLGELAISDPIQSGSSTKAFEMIVQEQMLRRVQQAGAELSEQETLREVKAGWDQSMQVIQRICANARYFTDSSKKPSIDVSAGECAAGMSIDFYGRFQAETLQNRTGSDRFSYITPVGGSTVSVDPIALLRGAPHAEMATLFIQFVLSEQGQKLWNWKPGTPDGPETYALRRSPMLRQLYDAKYADVRSDPHINPYSEAGSFVYHPEWTGRLFSPLRFIIKTAFIDPHQELSEAWAAIQSARQQGRLDDANRALAVFSELDKIHYEQAATHIGSILNKRTKIEEVQLARTLTLHFRDQYQRATQIANGQ